MGILAILNVNLLCFLSNTFATKCCDSSIAVEGFFTSFMHSRCRKSVGSVYLTLLGVCPWRCPRSVVSHTSCVICVAITTKNKIKILIKSLFGANVHYVPGLVLLAIGGAPTLALKLWLKNHIFIFSTYSLKPPANGTSDYAILDGIRLTIFISHIKTQL